MTSVQEEANIVEGMDVDVRSDGRSLLQVRQCNAKIGVVSHADGSCLVDLGGTAVLATVQAAVVPVTAEEGSVNVRIDCAPGVVACYAKNIGTTSNRFRSFFLSSLSSSVSMLFGSTATARDITEVTDEDEAPVFPTPYSPLPLRELYCGGGFGFQLTIDVQIMHAFGGSILFATSFAVRGALLSLNLPQVSVRESPMGFSVEVDKTKKFHKTIDWSESPVALVFHARSSRFLVDPSLAEEAALPCCVVAAFGSSGQLTHLNVSSNSSKRSDVARLGVNDLRQLVNDGSLLARACIASFDAQIRSV